ncbi:MAG TPA: hypothetical protein VLJ41_05825 [Segetibacter sp.]|nr:hypothetical protein [Segetibacter sp.]
MELDDLKQSWQKTNKVESHDSDIIRLIQNKNYGPVAALKKAFKKQIKLMIIVPFIIFFTNIDRVDRVLTSIMFWSYIAFCIGLITFSWFNYQMVKRMESMDGMVKANLEQQIATLQSRLKWKITGVRIALLYFILLAEVMPYFQHYSMLDKWHSLSLAVRLAAYVGFLLLQYFISTVVSHRKYGKHLLYLKQLANEMQ